MAWLEGKAIAMNLKFRGLPEIPELNSNLISALALCLTSLLNLEDGVALQLQPPIELALLLPLNLIFHGMWWPNSCMLDQRRLFCKQHKI